MAEQEPGRIVTDCLWRVMIVHILWEQRKHIKEVGCLNNLTQDRTHYTASRQLNPMVKHP